MNFEAKPEASFDPITFTVSLETEEECKALRAFLGGMSLNAIKNCMRSSEKYSEDLEAYHCEELTDRIYHLLTARGY